MKINLFYTFIYRKFVKETKGFWKKFYFIVKDILVKDRDVFVSTSINGFECICPYNCLMPLFVNEHPLYDKQLGRICQFLKEKYNKDSLNFLDVGANIGDTVLNIGDNKNKYLLVEGVENYYSLIDKNLKDFDYFLERTFVGEKSESTFSKKLDLDHGTGKIIFGSTSVPLSVSTIDTIVEKHSFTPDVLKIDTDGYDFAVLRGGVGVLAKNKPLVFFEWSLDELIENGEDPTSIFDLLNKNGYEELILFDNYGNLFSICQTSNIDYLKNVIEYTRNKIIFYYDVCAINRNACFCAQELWDYLK